MLADFIPFMGFSFAIISFQLRDARRVPSHNGDLGHQYRNPVPVYYQFPLYQTYFSLWSSPRGLHPYWVVLIRPRNLLSIYCNVPIFCGQRTWHLCHSLIWTYLSSQFSYPVGSAFCRTCFLRVGYISPYLAIFSECCKAGRITPRRQRRLPRLRSDTYFTPWIDCNSSQDLLHEDFGWATFWKRDCGIASPPDSSCAPKHERSLLPHTSSEGADHHERHFKPQPFTQTRDSDASNCWPWGPCAGAPVAPEVIKMLSSFRHMMTAISGKAAFSQNLRFAQARVLCGLPRLACQLQVPRTFLFGKDLVKGGLGPTGKKKLLQRARGSLLL